jgi:hypothetical protein
MEQTMRKVFHFDSPSEKYHCDAAVVWCYDNRFELAFRKLLKRIGIEHADPIRVAGGAKCLATPDQESEREFVLEQIRKSMRLHGTVAWRPSAAMCRPKRAIMRTNCSVPRRACAKPCRRSP